MYELRSASRDSSSMCLTPIYLRAGNYVDESTGMILPQYKKVPCGKCIECLQKKQVEQTVLAIEESKKHPSHHFFTLTYSPESVPISHRREYINLETGEFEGREADEIKRKLGYSKQVINFIEKHREKEIKAKIYENQERNKHCYVVESPIPTRSNIMAVDTYYLSLRRKDVADWIKRCRRKWEYNNPDKPLDFSYYGAGEYGSQTWRPHYHFQFFGLTDEQAAFFADEWIKNKGFVCLEKVDRGSSEDTIKVAQYVAKYITKIPLAFEDNEEHASCLKEGYIEKPRKQGSLYYGISEDFEKIKDSVLNGADTGIYDSVKAKEIINDKTTYHYAGNTYPIPSKIKDRIFKAPAAKGLRITPLRKAIIDILESRNAEVFGRQLRQIIASNHLKGEDLLQAFEIFEEKDKEDRRNRYENKKHDILTKYKKSKIK